MIRVTSLAVFVVAVAVLAGASASAQLPVAPAPRAVHPDGSRDPAPQPEAPAKAEDPAAVVDRIIKNSKDVGDKLAKTDTGVDTRKKQDKILSDIDALINRQDDPPPPKPDDNKDKKNDPMMKDPMMKDPMMKDPMMKDMPPPKPGDMPMDKKGMDMGKDGMPMPMPGMGDSQPMGRKPRMGEPMGSDAKKEQGDPKPDPTKPDDKKGGQKDPKDPKGPGANGGNPGGKTQPQPSLPQEEDVAKDVWGHLPPKLRQQMTQYYKEDVMPKYAELLRLYYSSLSEKDGAPVSPKK